MVESVLPVIIWLAVGMVSVSAGLVSVAWANRRFRAAMGQVSPQVRVADRARQAPISKAA